MVSFRSINENDVELNVSDDGIGMPEDVNFDNTESFGLQLISILVEDQLRGKMEVDRTDGTRYQIHF